MPVQVIYEPNRTTLKEKATQFLSDLFLKYRSETILFLCSGGSALSILDEVDSAQFDNCVTVAVLDERFSADPKINNFAQLAETSFYKKINACGCNFIDTGIQNNETQEQLAKRFSDSLKTWIENNEDGIIISTQGIGTDGHTAGIMPFPENPELFKELFEDERKWVVAYDAKEKNQYPLRVTTTIPFLKMIDHSVVWATGEDKKNILRNLNAQDFHENLDKMPALVLKKMKEVTLFTDQELS